MKLQTLTIVAVITFFSQSARAEECQETFEERTGMTFREALDRLCPRWDDPEAETELFEAPPLVLVIELESTYPRSVVEERRPTFLEKLDDSIRSDVDFYEPSFRPRKAYYPSKRFRPPRWEYIRLAGCDKGAGCKLIGRETSTGLNRREKAAASRILGRPFQNRRYHELALVATFGW